LQADQRFKTAGKWVTLDPKPCGIDAGLAGLDDGTGRDTDTASRAGQRIGHNTGSGTAADGRDINIP
jgi:hypothetical protein